MPSLEQLLSRVVERKGYAVQGADAEALFARRGEESLLAAWKLDGPVTAVDAQMFLTAMGQVHATSGILVAPKGLDEAAKNLTAQNKGVEIWAEPRLVIEVGETFVRDAYDGARAATPNPGAGATAFPPTYAAPAPAAPARPAQPQFTSLIGRAAAVASGDGHGAAYFMPNRPKEAPADMRATIQQKPGGVLGYAWGGAVGGASSGAATILKNKPRAHPSTEPQSAGGVVHPAADAELVGGSSKARALAAMGIQQGGGAAVATAPPAARGASIDADEDAYEIISSKKPATPAQAPQVAPAQAAAEARAPAPLPDCTVLRVSVTAEEAVAKTGKAGQARLVLVPHVAFEFDLEMNRPGMPAPITAKGAVLASTLTGELRTVDRLDFADKEPEGARREVEKLTAVDLYDKVKGLISKTYTRTMSIEREIAGETMMQTVKMSPDIDEMGLQHRGVVTLPVWEVTGSTGVTRIDAYTGNLVQG